MLSTAILRTLAYFDLSDFPLTAEEVFGYLWQGDGAKLEEVKLELSELVKKGKLETSESFYFFPGRINLIEKRNLAAAETEKKLTKARFAARLIGGIPFLKAVFVCNSVAAETTTPGSDIDFFIVGREGRLWFVRFFSNLILKVFGLRTGAKRSADRVCLSFFVDDRHLDLSGLRILEDDIYLAYWLNQLLPIYDPENILEKIHTENIWTRTYLKTRKVLPKHYDDDKFKSVCESFLKGNSGDSFEKIFKNIQFPKLRKELKTLSELGDHRVVIGDIILKFHENDARAELRDKWLINCKKYAV